MVIFIRAAHDEDKDALGALELRSSLALGEHIEELQTLPEASEISAAHLPHSIVAERDGKIVGFVTVLLDKDAIQAELENLFVAPEIWRMGLGRELLIQAEYHATVLGALSLRVVAGKRARLFYEASGYQYARTVATDFEVAAELYKDLSSCCDVSKKPAIYYELERSVNRQGIKQE